VDSKEGSTAKVGVFGIGLEAYWSQFDGLKERLEGYRQHVEVQLGWWAQVVSPGLVDTAPKANAAGERFAEERVDLLFSHATTYATSSQVLPAVQETNVPVVVLNLQPVSAFDYETADTGEWLANCSACCAPEISNAFERAGIPFNVVSGMLYEDEEAWRQIEEWCRAANVVRTLRGDPASGEGDLKNAVAKDYEYPGRGRVLYGVLRDGLRRELSPGWRSTRTPTFPISSHYSGTWTKNPAQTTVGHREGPGVSYPRPVDFDSERTSR